MNPREKARHDAKMAAIRRGLPGAEKPPRKSLFNYRRSTGLGRYEKPVIEVLVEALLDNAPPAFRDCGIINMEAWTDTVNGLELGEALSDLPDDLDRRAWTPTMTKAIRAAVEHELRKQGIHVVQSRQDLVLALAARGKLTETQLDSLEAETHARVKSVDEARRLRERGFPVYTIQEDGKVAAGVRPGKTYVALKPEAKA